MPGSGGPEHRQGVGKAAAFGGIEKISVLLLLLLGGGGGHLHRQAHRIVFIRIHPQHDHQQLFFQLPAHAAGQAQRAKAQQEQKPLHDSGLLFAAGKRGIR